MTSKKLRLKIYHLLISDRIRLTSCQYRLRHRVL